MSEKKFLPLFATQFLGAFNDNFLKNALVILMTYHTQQVLGVPASQMVALAGGIFILPFFLFSATAGQLADKYPKDQIIRWVKAAEIGIMLLAALGFISEHYPFLLLVLFLMGLHSTIFGPVKYSILPQMLKPDELVRGNAYIEAGTFLAILLGTIAGGVLITQSQGVWAVSIGLLLVSGLGFLTARSIPLAPSRDRQLKIQWNPVGPTAEIFKFAKKNRAVFLSILGISWFWLLGAAMLSVFPAYCKDWLQADERVVTLFLALFSIGIGVGSLLCEKLSRDRLELGLVPLGSMGMTCFLFDLFLAGRPQEISGPMLTPIALLSTFYGKRIVFDLILFSVFSGFFIVPLYTLMQERSESTHRSRVIAANNVLNALFMVIAAALLITLLRLQLTLPQIFAVLAALNALASIYIYSLLPEFLIRFVLWILAHLMYRLRVDGHFQVPQSGPVLLVCNHVSFVDWMIIAAAIKRPTRFVMDHAYYKGFLARTFMTQAKVIPISSSKESPHLLQEAFKKIDAELRDGQIVCIFPEGQITRDGHLNRFRPGVERVLAQCPVPVVPLALQGLWGSFFSRKEGPALRKLPRRFWHRVTLKIGAVIPPEAASAASLQLAVERLLENQG